MRILKKSHSAEKIEKGEPLLFLKILRGTLWRQKNQKQVAQCRKNSKGPLGPLGSVSYVKN